MPVPWSDYEKREEKSIKNCNKTDKRNKKLVIKLFESLGNQRRVKEKLKRKLQEKNNLKNKKIKLEESNFQS